VAVTATTDTDRRWVYGDCPTCGAAAGDPCTRPLAQRIGVRRLSGFHVDRERISTPDARRAVKTYYLLKTPSGFFTCRFDALMGAMIPSITAPAGLAYTYETGADVVRARDFVCRCFDLDVDDVEIVTLDSVRSSAA
jgi:hypothetical protein